MKPVWIGSVLLLFCLALPAADFDVRAYGAKGDGAAQGNALSGAITI